MTLVEVRKRHRYTQQALADKMGMDQTTIANYERGFCSPSKHFKYHLYYITKDEDALEI